MINWIKALWTKIFPKKEVVAPKVKHCGSHTRYKKSCPECQGATKNE